MSDPTGYRESPDTTDGPAAGNLVDGPPGHDRTDGGERDEAAALTTDDDAQQADSVERPGNSPD